MLIARAGGASSLYEKIQKSFLVLFDSSDSNICCHSLAIPRRRREALVSFNELSVPALSVEIRLVKLWNGATSSGWAYSCFGVGIIFTPIVTRKMAITKMNLSITTGLPHKMTSK